MPDTVTVQLSHHEARALVRSSEIGHDLLMAALGPHTCPPPEGHTIHPLESAVLKLEVALVADHAER